ncbi:uncharacterized protein [Leptinotarsa decemlineata]|uniref:uncharacterized protein n=1 Tax=Leptinotarsa decemlineata TaxID=7539 RepID=UPI003D30AA0A
MSLSNLYDKLETQLRALESLGVTSEKYAAMLFPLVESALPAEVLRTWERHRNFNQRNEKNDNDTSKGTNYLNMLLGFLKMEVESEERIHLAQKGFGKGHEHNKYHDSKNKYFPKQGEPELYTAAALYTANPKDYLKDKQNNCLFCDLNSHASKDCLKAQSLSIDERKSRIMKKRGCFSCLKLNHISKNCRAVIRCLICSKKHYPILCPNLHVKKGITDQDDKNPNNKVENTLTNNFSNETLLQTVVVKIVNNDKQKLIRTLLDSGSQRSYISRQCAAELRLDSVRQENIVQGVFGGFQSEPKIHDVYNIIIQNPNNTFETEVNVVEQVKICNNLPRLIDLSVIDYLKQRNIILSDTRNFDVSNEIQLLLGADVFGKLLTGKIENLMNGYVALETYLGWTIMGQRVSECSTYSTIFAGFTEFSIADLWNLDVIGIKDVAHIKTKDEHEEEVLKKFNQTITWKENRYEVHLPWIEGHPEIMRNDEMANSRLMSTTKKLRNTGKLQEYEKILHDWETLAIIEEAKQAEDKKVHYLPHHAVIKEVSITQR